MGSEEDGSDFQVEKRLGEPCALGTEELGEYGSLAPCSRRGKGTGLP